MKKLTLEEFLKHFSEYDSHYANYFSKEALITLYNDAKDWFFKDWLSPVSLVQHYAECPDWTWVKYYDEKNDTWEHCDSFEDLKSRTKVFELSNSILIEEWARCVCTVKKPKFNQTNKVE